MICDGVVGGRARLQPTLPTAELCSASSHVAGVPFQFGMAQIHSIKLRKRWGW